MTEQVRVRFAPSPTGLLHIGNARTALFNWLFARNKGGKFILRIEDTDFERSSKEFEDRLIADLRWMGLNWDEGPDIGGAFEPYRQSERMSLYKEYAEKLLREEKAYPCFCSREELARMKHDLILKRKTPKYDGRCSGLTREERKKNINEGRSYAIRFKIENQNRIDFNDLIKGAVSFGKGSLNDFVIIRSDNIASYNFAVVIDDALMNITHVIRGEDHLPNTPKQLLIYNALGFKTPLFAHLPMILDVGRRPLSKRSQDLSVSKLRNDGFLSKAMINYIILLGWSPEDCIEILPVENMIKYFSLKRVSRSPAVFDIQKLKWMNKQYIKNSASEDLLPLASSYLNKSYKSTDSVDNETLLQVIDIVKNEIETVSQIKNYTGIFFEEDINITDEGMDILKQKNSQTVINILKTELDNIDEIADATYQTIISNIKGKGLKGKKLFMPIRVAITGKTHGPELADLFTILKKDVMLKRIEKALQCI